VAFENRSDDFEIINVIDNIESCDSVESALTAYQSFIENFGFSSYLIGAMANPASQTKNDILTNWSMEWIDRWLNKNYVLHDPIVKFAARTHRPFFWDTAYDRGTKAGKLILNESKEFKLGDGMAIPIATEFGPLGCISLGTDKVVITEKEVPLIELVSIHLYQHLQVLSNVGKSELFGTLTKRETEVLHFVAEGKTNWEIGKILNLSEFSIKDHVYNITKKLKATNRTQAVSIAIRNGILLA